MARRASNLRFGTLFLALLIAVALWSMAHGSSSIERGFDLPIVLQGVPEHLVVTDQSADVVNIRVRGSRAALRNLSQDAGLEYGISLEGAQRGQALYEIDEARIEDRLPRGAEIVSRSPAGVELELERRGRRSVAVRADLEGQPAPGFRVASVAVDPPRVWLAGARSEVLRLSEVVTESIDLNDLDAPAEREVRLSLGGGHVWMEQKAPVKVRIQIEPEPTEEEGATRIRRGG